MARLRRAGCEAAGLEGVSPALRAWASDFSLRGQRKVTKRKATPANPTASRLPSGQSQRRTGHRRRHFGLRHPWLRPNPASNILVLAPNRGRPDPIWPLSAAATPSSLMASLTLPLTLGGLEGDQNRAHLCLRCFIRYSGKEWNSTLKGSASRAGCRSSSTRSVPSGSSPPTRDWRRFDFFRLLK